MRSTSLVVACVVSIAVLASVSIPLAIAQHGAAKVAVTPGATTSLYAIPVSGGAPRRLLSLRGQWGFPTPTPDGKSLALEQANVGSTVLWRAPLDGGRLVRMGALPIFTHPMIRSAGYIASEQEVRGRGTTRIALKLHTPRGGTEWTLVMPYPLGTPAASPDGVHVAVVHGRLLEDVDARTTRFVARDAAQGAAPMWMPDGRSLVYVDTRQRIVERSVGGRLERVVAQGPYFDPALSTDGKTVYALRMNAATSIPK